MSAAWQIRMACARALSAAVAIAISMPVASAEKESRAAARSGSYWAPQLEVAKQPRRSSDRGGRCTSERCYAARLIGWHSRLAECATGLRIGIIGAGADWR